MNWTETRDVLLDAGVPAAQLPEKWRPGIDLRGEVLAGVDLRHAYLRGVDFRDADLGGVDFRDANLCFAHLRDTHLDEADMRGANMRSTHLRDAHLEDTRLEGAQVAGAKLNWTSRDLVAELLRRHAGDNWQRRALAGLVLVSRDWCWKEFLALQHPEQEWALDVLAQYVQVGDNAPGVLRGRAAGEPALERGAGR